MVNGKTRKVCLIGNPVEHSMSPAMHNAAFNALNLDFIYVCFKVEKEKLKDNIKALRSLDFAGFNVTIPYKQDIMNELDEIDNIAKEIGAVNTVVNKNGKLIGFNTDHIGAVKAIEEKMPLKDKKVVLVGAGGAGRAIAYGIIHAGAKLTIMSRKKQDADELAKRFGCESMSIESLGKIKAGLLINATPLGMNPSENSSIVSKDKLRNFNAVFDIVYNPLQTKLLKEANEIGCITIDGLKMLVYQGAAAFDLWTGKRPDTKLMYDAAKKELTKD